MRWPAIGLALLTIGAGPQNPPASAPVRADAAVSGVVSDETTKQPIADAIVTLGVMATRDYPDARTRQLTDARGRFAFTDLPAGIYTISARKSGYLDGDFGRTAFAAGLSSAAAAGLSSTIPLADGQWFRTANVTMARPSGISGTVVDERGEPAVGVFVEVLTQFFGSGQTRLAAGPIALTDDRGRYRVSPLIAGRYLVVVPSVQFSSDSSAPNARPSGSKALPDPAIQFDGTTRLTLGHYITPPPPVDGQAFAYPHAFAGGHTIASASAIELEAGTERDGVDVRLEPVKAYRLSGTVEGPAESRGGLVLRLLAPGLEDAGSGTEVATTAIAPNGTFVFPVVPAGTYTLDAPLSINNYAFRIGDSTRSMFYGAQPPSPPGLSGTSTFGGGSVLGGPGAMFTSMSIRGREYWGRTTVTVSGQHEDGVVVTMRKGATVSGRIATEIDPTFPTPAAAPRFMSLEPANGDAWLGNPRSVDVRNTPEGQFVIAGVLPGRFVFRTELAAGWILKSIVFDGRDYTYAPVDLTNSADLTGGVVTFTNAVPTLSGTARDANGPAMDAAIILFPADRRQWIDYGRAPTLFRVARTSGTGSYRIPRVPAGDYLALAVPIAHLDKWHEAGFFNKVEPLATRVSIAWGEQKTLHLHVERLR
jgi:hypothetical protein